MAVPDAHGRVVARLMTARRVPVEEVAFFNDSKLGTYLAFGRMDNSGFLYEFSVTWSSLDADRIVSVFTPDCDHHVGLMGGASAGPLVRGGCDSNDVSDVVPNGCAHQFGSMAKGDRFSRVLDEEISLFEASGSRGVWERYVLDAKGRQTLPNLGRSR